MYATIYDGNSRQIYYISISTLYSGIPFGLEVKMMYYIKYWAYYVKVKILRLSLIFSLTFNWFCNVKNNLIAIKVVQMRH